MLPPRFRSRCGRNLTAVGNQRLGLLEGKPGEPCDDGGWLLAPRSGHRNVRYASSSVGEVTTNAGRARATTARRRPRHARISVTPSGAPLSHRPPQAHRISTR